MKSNYEQSRGAMRSEIRSKRRKTNMVLNGLIGLVLLLIIIVSVSIFSKDDAKPEQQGKTVENKINANDNGNEATKSAKQDQATSDDDASNESENAAKTEQEKEDPTITEGGGDNIQRTIIDPSWEPVGTTQSGPNANASVDWDERVKALAYAINVDESNMTVWYLSRNGQDQAIGTVTAKDNPQQAYRVYLEWVDSEGWKPSKVEELIENDKGQ